MRQIQLEQSDIYKGNLILVNQTFPLKDTYRKEAEELIAADTAYPHILMDVRAAAVLSLLIHDIDGRGKIIPVSGYRTFAEQKQLYMDSLACYGEVFTKKYVAFPNTSEHQTGLAIDLSEERNEIDFICPAFPESGICQTFRERAVKYGFIQRYPSGKEAITGISPEPWHFRYVGYPHSEIIKNQNFTLEEYTVFLKQFHCQTEPYRAGDKTEVFYVDLHKQNTAVIQIPEHMLYQISGDNADGCIITLWRDAK